MIDTLWEPWCDDGLKPSIGASRNESHRLNQNMLMHIPWLDGKFNDYSENVTLTDNGHSFVMSGRGGTPSFNNSNQWFAVSPNVVMSAAASSFSVWFRTQYGSTGGSSGIFVSSGQSQGYIYASGTGAIRVADDAGLTQYAVETMAAGRWHHCVVTRESNTTRVFVNGVESTTGGVTKSTQLTIIQIAKYKTGGSHWYDGEMDDMRVYDRALTPNEALTLYLLTRADRDRLATPLYQEPVAPTGFPFQYYHQGADIV